MSDIKIIREPTVYLVGRQQTNDIAINQFLADHDVQHWTTDTDVVGEELVEIAGRLCFDDQTFVLTDCGWLLFSKLSGEESIATLNTVTRNLEFQRPIAIHQYDYDGDMIAGYSRDVSFVVTPEHRQFASRRKKHGWGAFEWFPTCYLLDKQFRVLTAPAGWVGRVPETVTMRAVSYQQAIANQFGSCGVVTHISKTIDLVGYDCVTALARLVAHYVANGSIVDQKGSGRGIVVYGREFEEIQSLAGTIGLRSSVYIDGRNGCQRTQISGGLALANWFDENCGRGFAEKKFPQWVLNLPVSELKEVWSILVKTDGHRYKSGREVFMTGSQKMAGQTQEILAKLGYSSYLTTIKGDNGPCFTVSKKMGRPATLHASRIRKIPYKGKVYCATTDNGIVLVRRDGRVHFSGNCYLSYAAPRPGGNHAYIDHILKVGHGSVVEHAVWNFIVVGISRSCSHELVRHRVGMSPSQLSQRYVDESVAEYVEPDIIANDHELHQIWLEAMMHAHAAYVKLSEKLASKLNPPERGPCNNLDCRDGWQSSPLMVGHYVACPTCNGCPSNVLYFKPLTTDMKKAARQAARSVLPNATETKLFLTLNARSLRHFIELRASRHAEPEIRKLAVKILEIMCVEAPNLFGDYRLEPLPDGTYEAVTDYRKV